MKFIMTLIGTLSFICAFSQSTDHQLPSLKGKKLELTYTASRNTSSVGDMKMDVTVIRSYDIEDTTSGSTVIEHKIKKIKFNAESMMGNQSFDSDKEEDMKGDMGKVLEERLKSKYTLTVDPTGKITHVKSDNDDKDKNLNPQAQMIMGLIEQAAGKLGPPAVGDKFELVVMNGTNLSNGQSWTDSTATGKTVYTVKNLSDQEIHLDYIQNVSTEEKQDLGGMTATISVDEKTTGQIKIDRKTGLLIERSASTTGEGSMNVMGQSMPLSIKSNENWKVK